MKFLDHETVDRPFFAMVGTPAAHAPFTSAPQYDKEFAGIRAPRNAAWNASTDDKHHLMRSIPPFTQVLHLYHCISLFLTRDDWFLVIDFGRSE
jgi:hypothetical protein